MDSITKRLDSLDDISSRMKSVDKVSKRVDKLAESCETTVDSSEDGGNYQRGEILAEISPVW